MKIAGPLISLSTVLMLFLVELRQSGREPLRAKNVGLRGCSTGIPWKISSFQCMLGATIVRYTDYIGKRARILKS